MKFTIATYYLHRLAAGAVLMALCTTGMAQPQHGDRVGVPPVPADIQAPQGHKAFLKGFAVGTQNFFCTSSGWAFVGPQATLFLTFPAMHGEARQQIATHFLSPNPAEPGTARPTWQSSADTSAVWGKVKASSSDPAYVAPGAIPWLLLEAAGAQRGAIGGAGLSQTTFLQRINTAGGAMPPMPCTPGSMAFVPYVADYVFYKAER
jgi:hypothetical protein